MLSSRTLLSGWGIACLLGVLTAGCDRQSPAPEQANSAAPASDEVAPAAAGTPTPPIVTGKIDRSRRGTPAPTAGFLDPAGKPVSIASFKGKPVLVNLWATWCAPCVKEMPTLDALAQSGAVRVVAVSQDLQPDKVGSFFAEKKFTALQPYKDPKLGLSLALAANLPMTILYDSTGHEVWRMAGSYDWSTPEARSLMVAS